MKKSSIKLIILAFSFLGLSSCTAYWGRMAEYQKQMHPYPRSYYRENDRKIDSAFMAEINWWKNATPEQKQEEHSRRNELRRGNYIWMYNPYYHYWYIY